MHTTDPLQEERSQGLEATHNHQRSVKSDSDLWFTVASFLCSISLGFVLTAPVSVSRLPTKELEPASDPHAPAGAHTLSTRSHARALVTICFLLRVW